MKRHCHVAVKYVIGISLALIAVSNCFNVLSKSTVFLASPAAVVARSERTTSALGKLNLSRDSGSSLLVNPRLNSANRHSATFFAGLRPAGHAIPFAAMLTATKTDNTNVLVNPGGTIMYTIEITNTGDAPANSVQLMDTLDANVTLQAGTVKVSPIAVNDNYNTIGNVNISVPAPGVISNDLNPNGSGTLAVTQVNATAVPGGGSATAATTNGSVTMSSDGSFGYTPNAGFSGSTDIFTYTLSNSATPGKTDTATVTITSAAGSGSSIAQRESTGTGGLTRPSTFSPAWEARIRLTLPTM